MDLLSLSHRPQNKQRVTPAHEELDRYLRFRASHVSCVQMPIENKLVVRLDGERHKDFLLTSVEDAGRCFSLLVRYLIRNKYIFEYSRRPLAIKVAFGDKSYILENIMPDENLNFIPKSAPEYWLGKCHAGEEMEVFFARVWAKYIHLGLDSAILKRLDKKLWKAIQNFPALEKRPWPDEFKLPTSYTKLAEALELFDEAGWEALSETQKTSVLRKKVRDEVKAATGLAAAKRPAAKAAGCSARPSLLSARQ